MNDYLLILLGGEGAPVTREKVQRLCDWVAKDRQDTIAVVSKNVNHQLNLYGSPEQLIANVNASINRVLEQTKPIKDRSM